MNIVLANIAEGGAEAIVDMVGNAMGIFEKIPGGKIIGAIILFLIFKFIIGIIVKVIKKALGKTSLDNKLEKYVGTGGSSIESTLASIIGGVMLLFAALFSLDYAGMSEMAEPIKNMLNSILGALPNILVAGIIGFIAYFIANLLKQLVENVLNAARIDERLGNAEGNPIANALATVAFSFVLLVGLSAAVDALGIAAIADPLKDIVSKVFAALPKVFLAGVLLAIGAFLAKIAGTLIKNLLVAVGADQLPAKVGIADIPTEGSKSVSGVVSSVVSLSIIVLLAAQAITSLELPLLQNASSGLVDGYFNLLLAVIIFGAGLIASKFAYQNLADKNLMMAKIARIAIIVLVGVVALKRSGLGGGVTEQVFNYGIMAVCFATAVGGAIAFGLGGKDYVNRWFDKRG